LELNDPALITAIPKTDAATTGAAISIPTCADTNPRSLRHPENNSRNGFRMTDAPDRRAPAPEPG
jgi:hypothetical protein